MYVFVRGGDLVGVFGGIFVLFVKCMYAIFKKISRFFRRVEGS